jgi:hypothetical protein
VREERKKKELKKRTSIHMIEKRKQDMRHMIARTEQCWIEVRARCESQNDTGPIR